MSARTDPLLLAAGVILAACAPPAGLEAAPGGPGAVLLSCVPPAAGGLALCWLARRPGGR